MRKMKDSGIPWLGFVNERYQVIRLKYIADVLDQYRQPITADKRNQNSDILYDYYGASGAIDKIDGYTIDDHVMLIGEDGANLRMRNLPLMYEVNGKAWINNHAHILKPKAKTDFYYLFYALESLDINPYVTGSAQPKLNQESLKNIVLPYPSLPEQKKIADFLDAKCADIDQIRADIEKQIEILTDYKKSIITEAVTKGLAPKAKLKDSGIEWIGKIPEGWCVKKLKYVFAEGEFGLKIGPFGSALKDCVIANGDYKVYNQAHVISNDFSLSRHFVSEESYNRLYSYRVLPDDILFSMMGTIGKCRIMPRGYPKGIMDSHLLKARLKNFILPSFFQYVYDKDNSTIIYTQLEQYANGTIMNGLNSSIIKKLVMPVPPLSEQKAIADYLDEKCSAIDATIAEKQKQLETLEEYKKSLIFEYVTGKKEVV